MRPRCAGRSPRASWRIAELYCRRPVTTGAPPWEQTAEECDRFGAPPSRLDFFDCHGEPVMLKLLVIKLRFFPSVGGDDAFTLLMHLKHVPRGFLFSEREHFHEHKNYISHLVHWIVPDNNVPAFLESFLNLLAGCLDRRRE